MEISETNATGSPAPTATARRSGRVSKVPDKFSPDAPAASKRKRGDEFDEEDAENDSVLGEEDADDDADDTGDDEGPARPRKKSSQSAKAKKPAAKKPKINGDAPESGNHAARLPSRPKKHVRIEVARREGDELYGAISCSDSEPLNALC